MSNCLLISCVQEDVVNSYDNGKNIVLAINDFIEKNRSMKIIVVNDWHNKNNKIFEKEDIHCVKGTNGAKIYKGLNIVESHCKVFYKGMSEDSKNAFFEEGTINSKLDKYLQEMKVEKIFICGFDIEETIKTAEEKGYGIEVVENAVNIAEKKKKKKKDVENSNNEDIIVESSESSVSSESSSSNESTEE